MRQKIIRSCLARWDAYFQSMAKTTSKSRAESQPLIVIDGVKIRLAPLPRGRSHLKTSEIKRALMALGKSGSVAHGNS